MKFEIGQQVFRASWEAERAYVICPECAGQKQLRVILPDETIVGVDCAGCSHGYDGSRGVLEIYDRKATVKCETITGLEIRNGKTEWQTNGTYCVSEDNLFLDAEASQARADEIASQANREELERIEQKEKSTRSWSWHVHYHRREIREAQRRLEYHTKKLAVARAKAKEPESRTPEPISQEKQP